ncbi:MAG: hypothetical protein IGS03_05560 [Candidatus Sericytochromatia bacterium]|nr:hypothetical protein [Candidatus Sericytochromatia bacterium]
MCVADTARRLRFESLYTQAHQILLHLSQDLDRSQGLPAGPLKQAADLLAEALTQDPGQARAYVLLAVIFLALDKRQLVDKYLLLAERCEPDFPALIALKNQLLTPAALHKKKRSVALLARDAIQQVRSLDADTVADTAADKPAERSAVQRFAAPILPLLWDAPDLQRWIQSCFGQALTEPQLQQLWLLLTDPGELDAKTQLLQLREILQSVDAEYGRRPSAFFEALAQSPAGLTRQLRILLQPLAKLLKTPQQLSQALVSAFETSPSSEQTAALFALIHAPPVNEPVPALQGLKSLLDTLYPDAVGQKLDLQPFLERLQQFAASVA